MKVGEAATWSATRSRVSGDATGIAPTLSGQRELRFTWDFGDTDFLHTAEATHTFHKVGFHRIGLNVSNGRRTDLAWRDVYVVRDVEELGTEGEASRWSIEDFHERNRSNEQVSRAVFTDTESDHLVGKTALQVDIKPYAGFRVALRYPKINNAHLRGKTKLVFWLKSINEDVTGWQGGPFISIDGDNEQRRWIEPKPGLDLMRQLDHNEAREGWRLMEIPLNGNEQWQIDGDMPANVRSISLCFDSWGAPPLRFWIDGLAFE